MPHDSKGAALRDLLLEADSKRPDGLLTVARAEWVANYLLSRGAALEAGPSPLGNRAGIAATLEAALRALSWSDSLARVHLALEIVRGEAGPPPLEPSPEAIDAYWRAWATTPRPSDDSDTQEAHLAGLRAAYATDFGKPNDKET